MNNGEQEPAFIEGQAGAPEGTPAVAPTTEAVASMYQELGIKAPAPTGATKGRPKSADLRAENDDKNGAGSSNSGSEKNLDDKDESKNAQASSKNGNSGDNSDAKGSKVGKDSGKVSDESEKTNAGVRKAESKDEADSKRTGEDDSVDGADRTGQAANDENAETEENDDAEEGKRPGKSNPEVEKRFQKLTAEIKARDELIAKQAKELEETQRKDFEAKVAQQDPEYTLEDFRKVRDEEGNIIDLDKNQAELAWRRWKDGYDQRKVEREAKFNHEREVQENQQRASEALMRSSVEAYDVLTGIADTYPELSKNSGKFDKDFADAVMPLIEESVIYHEGTEPGNAEGLRPVIVGLKIHPKKILDAMNTIKQSKRTLPLNGINDNVEVKSNVSVPHGRSSDPNINAANDLYKSLGIDKRL